MGTLASPQSDSSPDTPTDFFSPPTPSDFTISTLNSTETALNATLPVVECFTNTPAQTYKTVNLVVCTAIFPSFILQPEVLQTKQFTPNFPYNLPKRFTAGDCSIRLSTRFANARDMFQEIEILQRAAMVLDKCVRGKPLNQRLGGTVSVGPRGAFEVSVGDKSSLAPSPDAAPNTETA
ncbi:hypothetical protein ACLMJK_008527 [Lecanora helva]